MTDGLRVHRVLELLMIEAGIADAPRPAVMFRPRTIWPNAAKDDAVGRMTHGVFLPDPDPRRKEPGRPGAPTIVIFEPILVPNDAAPGFGPDGAVRRILRHEFWHYVQHLRGEQPPYDEAEADAFTGPPPPGYER